MQRVLVRLLISILALAACETASAAAFQFYELSAPSNGTANVGQAAIASDASTSYFNPAGMTALKSTQLMLGVQPQLTYTNFSPNSSTTITGNNGSNAGGFLPGVGGFYSYHYSPRLSFGTSITMPYGGALNYDNHWVGRYVVQQMLLYTINVNPSVAYQVNDCFSVGGGIAVEYANLYQTTALPISASEDGQITLKLDNVSPGVNLGALYAPTLDTKVGIAYRSQIIHHLRGSASFMNIAVTPSASTKLIMPSNIIASLTQKLNCQWTLLGELGWANWSSMANTMVTVSSFSGTTADNWHDTYRVGLGAQYLWTEAMLMQAGASFDSSPTSMSKRLPSLPMDGQARFGLGMIYGLAKAVHLGVSYEFIHLGKASINNTSPVGVMAGQYTRNNANVLQASINVDC